MRKVRISLDPRDFDELARQLRKYAAEVDAMAHEVTRQMCETAASTARELYSGNVTVEATEDRVIASGRDVVFEEFGAGARISDPFPGGADVSFDIRKGAYSDLAEGEYQRSGYREWHHGGERFEYITPTNALFLGMEEARARAAEIAEEVFG